MADDRKLAFLVWTVTLTVGANHSFVFLVDCPSQEFHYQRTRVTVDTVWTQCGAQSYCPEKQMLRVVGLILVASYQNVKNSCQSEPNNSNNGQMWLKFIRNSYFERRISTASLLLCSTRLHLTGAVTPSELALGVGGLEVLRRIF